MTGSDGVFVAVPVLCGLVVAGLWVAALVLEHLEAAREDRSPERAAREAAFDELGPAEQP